MARLTISDLQAKKDRGELMSMAIVYDYTTAKIADKAGVDSLLVGDSAARHALGYNQNANITMDEMIVLARSAVRGSERAVVFVDMPFMSYQVNLEEAVRNAGRFIREAGVQAVKMEGNEEIADAVRAVVRAGIPVQGHMGFTPMTTMAIGGAFHSEQATKPEEKFRVAAFALQEAGCSSIMFTQVPAEVTRQLTKELRVPTFNGAPGNFCDAFLAPVGLRADLAERGPDQYGPTPAGVMYDRLKGYVESLKAGKRPTHDGVFTSGVAAG